jgi:hypothetical protein
MLKQALHKAIHLLYSDCCMYVESNVRQIAKITQYCSVKPKKQQGKTTFSIVLYIELNWQDWTTTICFSSFPEVPTLNRSKRGN